MTDSLLSGVAATISHRDREQLDRAFGGLLLRFLQAHSVILLRLVDIDGTTRVVRRVALTREQGELADIPDETVMQPALTDIPAWHECVTRNDIISCTGPLGHRLTHLPVHGERGVVGILIVDTPTELEPREIDLVRGILEIIKNHLALLDYGEQDTLTGLLNRKTFEFYFDKLRTRLAAACAAEPSWLALLDIDHFKSINDTHGHLFGDEVLLLISQILKRTFRGADQLFRFGGEEFVIVLDRTTDIGAQIAFERLRAAIEGYDFPQVGRVTGSLGYTRIDSRDLPATCVERADAALYHAKNHGRNNVRNYETLLGTGDVTARVENHDVEMF
jgi:diguanylate cyclase (GGDEF)-like protein